MFDGSGSMFLNASNLPWVLQTNVKGKMVIPYRKRWNSVSSITLQTSDDENGYLSESKKNISCVTKDQIHSFREETVGIIGGVSVLSTFMFLEKLVWWSSRDGKDSLPFLVCNDPTLSKLRNNQTQTSKCVIVENLRQKRALLEVSGVGCIVMPCHISQVWHGEIFEGCSLPVFNVGECVARELKDAKMKPLEAGSNVRIGLLSSSADLSAGFYQEILESEGFEVVLPDQGTMEHIVIPSFEALKRKDVEGAKNMLCVAVQTLRIRAVNVVVLASDELLGLLSPHDPLFNNCINPMDALARSTVKWMKSANNVQRNTY